MNGQSTSSEEVRRVVVTVHGIRTFGQWQERLSALIHKANDRVATENHHYGYFSVLSFLIPPLRWFATLKFRRHLRQIAERYPNAVLDLVGHSFGTHLIGYSVYNMRDPSAPRFGTILLAGSVLRSSFPWGDLINEGRVSRVINDCGIHDNVLLLSQFAVLFTGMAGRLGFRGMTSTRFLNRYFEGGHSHYFLADGKESDAFMERYWLPVLAYQQEPEHHDARAVKGPLQGVVVTALQIADPIKLGAYGLVAILIVLNAYVYPKREARANAAAAVEADRARRIELARMYFEGRNDLARATATLADLLGDISGLVGDTRTEKQLLRYWLPQLVAADDAVANVARPAVLKHSFASYLLGSDVYRVDGGEVEVAIPLDGGKRGALFMMGGTVEIVDFETLETRSIALGMVQEAMQSDAFGTARMEMRLRDRVLARFDDSGELWSAEAELIDKTSLDGAVFADLDQIKEGQIEDYQTVVEPLTWRYAAQDEQTGRIVTFGYKKSHSAGGQIPKMLVIDPRTGTTGAIEVEHIYGAGPACGELRLQGALVRPGLEGEDPVVVTPAVSDLRGRIEFDLESPPHCPRRTTLLTRMAFPRAREEHELWSQSTTTYENWEQKHRFDETELVDNDYSRETDAQLSTPFRTIDGRIDPTVFAGLESGGVPAGAIYEGDFSAYNPSVLAWDKQIAFVSGSDGSKYGFTTMCRFQDGITTACVRIRCMGNFCHRAEAPGQRLIALSSMKEFGNDSLYVLDVDKFELISLPSTPEGGVNSLEFDMIGRLAAVTSLGELWTYGNLKGDITVNQTALTPFHGNEDEVEFTFYPPEIDDDFVSILTDASVSRVNRFTHQPRWISTPAFPTVKGRLGVVAEDGVIAVFDVSSLRLLDAETGIYLSGVMRFEKFLAELPGADQDLATTLHQMLFGVNDDGSVDIVLNGIEFTRARPLSDSELSEALERVPTFTGVGAQGTSLPDLPLSTTAKTRADRGAADRMPEATRAAGQAGD
ncbi:MAG: hypothetical protein KF823_00975 [Xanthomonadales bacterium]|nr:hypothetical protein [Xanthomonadales bacterium]